MSMVCMLSACHPCLPRDIRQCQRWLARECSALPMHGSALIESSHDPLSSGYTYDSVPLGQAVMECDTSLPCPFLALPLPLSFLWIASLLILIAYALPCLLLQPPLILSYLFLPYLEEKCETLPCG